MHQCYPQTTEKTEHPKSNKRVGKMQRTHTNKHHVRADIKKSVRKKKNNKHNQ